MTLTPSELRTDDRVEPLGIDAPAPAFSWAVSGTADQAAYQVQVTLGEDIVWDSGPTHDPRPFGAAYGGAPLVSDRRYAWRVRLWDADSTEPGPWSEPAAFETGVLDPALWQACWVTGPAPTDKKDRPALYLRATAELSAPVVRGRAFVSALGWYRFFVNGVDLTGPALVPRWTPLDDYVEYQSYDVTSALGVGTNVLAMAVADGRYRGKLGFASHPAVYGNRLAGFVQIHLDLADGSTAILSSGDGWQAGTGRIRSADPKDGERVDLRIPDADWRLEPAAPARFARAEILPESRQLVAEEVGRVRQVQTVAATSVTRTPSGKQLVDFGQNFAGVVRVRLTGPAGTTVRLLHSELVGNDGELALDYLHPFPFNKVRQLDEVILDGAAATYQPWFAIHGFRYVEVDGLPGDLDAADIEGVVLSSDLQRAGTFECSNADLNQLYSNVWWSTVSNLMDTPTDCPTRERAGWMGDIQVFAPTATKLLDVKAYLRRYLRNAATEQRDDGTVAGIVPSEKSAFSGGGERGLDSTSVGWGDALVMLPLTLYRAYGDADLLRRQYPSMVKWVDQLARRARTHRSLWRRIRGTGRPELERYIVDSGFHYGEWIRPDDNTLVSIIGAALAPNRDVIATAYLANSARLLSDAAEALGRADDAARYRQVADNAREAYRAAFVKPDGRIGVNTQDEYVRAIAFDLLDPAERARALHRLVQLIDEAGDHLGTGFLSTAMLLPVLADNGHAELAYRLLLQDTSPSWLNQIKRGATTIWESWEGYNKKGAAQASHNHYAFGAVANFLVERVAGLAPAEPGYRVVDVRPLIGGGLTHARGSLRTPYGEAVSSWRLDGRTVTLDVTVPNGATARVQTGNSLEVVGAGTHAFTWTHAGASGKNRPHEND